MTLGQRCLQISQLLVLQTDLTSEHSILDDKSLLVLGEYKAHSNYIYLKLQENAPLQKYAKWKSSAMKRIF